MYTYPTQGMQPVTVRENFPLFIGNVHVDTLQEVPKASYTPAYFYLLKLITRNSFPPFLIQ